jgi:putative colanic acid biosynthesis acetyltransferase WcaF
MELKGYTTGGFDRGASKAKDALWFLVRFVFFANALPWPSPLRVGLLRLFGAKIGQRVVVRSNVNITFPWRLTVGDDVWIGDEVFILSLAPVAIESSVCISQRAFLCAGSHRFHSPGFDLVTKPITIYRGSWIAAQAFIAPGVEIGPDSMVGAGAVVLNSVPPGTTVLGNPACVKTLRK